MILQALIEALTRPEAYPEKTRKVELLQTQMSFVFITDDFAYKVKKPVNLGYLDYTTLDKRLHFCSKELELNRRLAPDMYISVVPVVKQGAQIRITGEGEIVDYAVKMKRLPVDRLMDQMLLAGQVTDTMVFQVAQKLVAFHDMAESSTEIGKFGEPDAIRRNTQENFDQTIKYIGQSITEKQYRYIRQFTDAFMQQNGALFKHRVARGRIRDCHGDLHAAHICFANGITIFDCIEFNDRFRYCDVASEVSFLAMDIDRYERADLARVFIDAYIEYSGDEEIRSLVKFYKCYRAYVRGKVESFKLDDPYIADKKPALAAAQSYFTLANRFARGKPVLLIMSGLVATGKTTLAAELSRRYDFVVISSDVIRKTLASIPLTEHRYSPFKSDIYSDEFTQKTYSEMFNQAKLALARGQWVILDASFKRRNDRIAAKAFAGREHADFFAIECILDEHLVKNRLVQRAKQGSVSDGRWEIYVSQKQDFDPVTELAPDEHIVVDTSEINSASISNILERFV